jgi:hypothetical protein
VISRSIKSDSPLLCGNFGALKNEQSFMNTPINSR